MMRFGGITFACILLAVFGEAAFGNSAIPSLNINFGESADAASALPAMKILGILTVLSVAPAILLMMTSFTRILVVLSFVRQALGAQSMPPNQVVVGMALFLTAYTMGPVWDEVYTKGLSPYMASTISQEQAFDKMVKPVRNFMLTQVREQDLALFFNIAKLPKPNTVEDVSLRVLIPAFMISELNTAFQIGFLVYIPFLVIDMVVSAVLMAMGMMMLPPTVVSLPFKLVLFVLVDGWSLIVSSVVKSFQMS